MIRYALGLASAVLLLFHGAPPAAVAQTAPPLAAEALEAPEPVPLVVWNHTVAVLRAPYEGSPPAERVQRAAARITALPPRGDWEIISAKTTIGKYSGFIVGTKTTLLLGLLPEDVDPASGKTLEETARLAAQELQAVLDARAEQQHWPVFLRGLGFTAGATLVYGAVLWLVFLVRRMGMRRLDRLIAQSRKTLTVAGINLVPILHGFQRAVGRLTSLAAALVATYLWLTFCFAQFFYTEPWAKQLGGFLLGILKGFALGIAGAVPGLFAVLVIFWLTRIAAAAAARFFNGVERGTLAVPWLHPDTARASRRIVVVAIWMFALTVAYPYIPGSGSEAFKGISVFAGLMLTLGSSGFVNHVMSGLMMAYSSALRPGEYVRIGDVEGKVLELGLMSTKIATPKEEWVTIPNGVVVSGGVTNYTRLADGNGAWVSTTVTIGYDTPWRQVHALLLGAAACAPGVRKAPGPRVLQRALSDFYVEYELRFTIDRPEERAAVLSAVLAAIQDAFNDAGVQIMSPHFEAQPEEPVLAAKDQGEGPTAPMEPTEEPDPAEPSA